MPLGAAISKPTAIYRPGPFRDRIASSPSIHANSSTWVGYLSEGGTNHVLNCGEYSIKVYPAHTSNTNVTVLNDTWGPPYPWRLSPNDQAIGIPVPIDPAATVPPGFDATVCVERRNGSGSSSALEVWELWFSTPGSPWQSGWGGHNRFSDDGDGYGTFSGASGSSIPHTGVIARVHEIAAGWIPHPLAFSCDCVHTTSFVSPAQKTDGNNAAGKATPIPEGTRFQLDPSASLSGLTRLQTIIARCLQVYGAYCYDIGGSRMALVAERAHDASDAGDLTNVGSVYNQAGGAAIFTGGYINLDSGGTFPWSSLRALA